MDGINTGAVDYPSRRFAAVLHFATCARFTMPMQPLGRSDRIVVVVFVVLALLNLLTRDYLKAAGWGLLSLALWLRSDRSGSAPRWRTQLGNVAFGGAVVILVLIAAQLLRRIII